MAYNVADIQTLITNGKVVNITEILTTNAYVSIGYWQKGQRKANSGSNAYPQYAINLQQLLLAAPGTPIIIKDEGGIVSNNVLSMDFQGAGVTVTPDPLDPNPLNPSQVIVTIPGGGGGGLTISANSGTNVIGAPGSQFVQLGTNPLLADTVIPTNTSGFNLSLTGTGKFGVGLTMPTGLGTAGKVQVRGNGSASLITGDVSGTTLTVTNCSTCPAIPGVNVYTGTITVGDYIVFNGTPNYTIGVYVTAQTSPTTYTLSAAPGNRTATGNQTNGLPAPNTQVIGNGAFFSISQSLLRLETLGGVRAFEAWENGMIKIAGVGGNGTTIWNDGNNMSVGFAAPPMVSNVSFATPSIYTQAIQLTGTPTTPGQLLFSGSGFSSITSPVGSFDINYISTNKGHRFVGKAALANFWDAFQFPSVFGGSQASAGYGARNGYELSVYQPFQGTVSYTLSGYIDNVAGKLYIYGCTGTGTIPAGYLQVGHTLSYMLTYTTGIPEGTAISTIVTAWDPGTTDPITGLCPGTQTVGVYDLETNGGPYTGPAIGSVSSLKNIYFSAYPAWNDTRAMYVDGTITFKNLPQSSTGVPAYLSSGDMWVDTSLAGDYALKIKP